MNLRDERDILDRLCMQQAELAALRQQVACLQRDRPRSRRWRRIVPLAFLAALLALVPLGVFGASFVDLNPGSVHNANINAIADAGISKGCTDATHYCPNDFVTREQMASFLARTAGLGSNPPVANAATLQGFAPSGLARVGFAKKTTFNDLTTAFVNQATVAITAPGPGYVLLIGSISFDKFNASACEVQTRIIPVGAMVADIPVFYTRLGTDAEASEQAAVTGNMVYAVAGGARSFALQSKDSASCGNSPRALDAALSAIFIPFGSTGTTP